MTSKLDTALLKVGATLAEFRQKSPTNHQYYLRVDPEKGEAWVPFVKELLFSSDDALTIDVSKVFYLDNGQVRYLWRLICIGNVEGAQDLLIQSAIGTVARRNEVTEVRLNSVSPANVFAAMDGRAEARIAPHFAMAGGSKT